MRLRPRRKPTVCRSATTKVLPNTQQSLSGAFAKDKWTGHT
ncbi:hypothetical protein L917_19077 [Phytophthora nicotianae]|uniref:Uncharacterized protein n=1 Tax=Phytophthora nicotianae TaxID=4792 RepID=W2K5I7_PHYNI|nr:hypothetical protein L917_19077 [Phytophthora nicotianae]